MKKVGVTGGIGSGKTSVSCIFKQQGAQLIKADDLAKRLMNENEAVRRQIIKAFGSKSYKKDGSLNRSYLAEEAFSKGRVETLNNIVHPAVFDASDVLFQQAEKEGVDILVYEAAILLQRGRPEVMDYIVLVLADEQVRIQRVSKRDRVEESAVRARMEKQDDYELLESKADYIIKNNGTKAELKKKSLEIYKQIIQKI